MTLVTYILFVKRQASGVKPSWAWTHPQKIIIFWKVRRKLASEREDWTARTAGSQLRTIGVVGSCGCRA